MLQTTGTLDTISTRRFRWMRSPITTCLHLKDALWKVVNPHFTGGVAEALLIPACCAFNIQFYFIPYRLG